MEVAVLGALRRYDSARNIRQTLANPGHGSCSDKRLCQSAERSRRGQCDYSAKIWLLATSATIQLRRTSLININTTAIISPIFLNSVRHPGRLCLRGTIAADVEATTLKTFLQSVDTFALGVLGSGWKTRIRACDKEEEGQSTRCMEREQAG